jgi:DNA polymerase III subunit epsilon
MSSSSNDRGDAGLGRTRESPPPGPPWDAPLADAPLLFVDLEMTGLDPARDSIVQICLERVVGEATIDRLCSFVRPEVAAGAGMAIHGIGEAELAAAPPIGELAERIVDLLHGAVLVGHAVSNDAAFLEAELGRVGRAWKSGPYLDTLALARRALSLPSHRLGALAQALGIAHAAHRADEDVRVTRAIFGRVTGVLGATTPRALWEISTSPRRARPEVIEAAQRAAALGQPARLRYRPCGRPPQELCFHVTAVRTDLDPPVVLGYLDPGRGRRELRADRILSLEIIGHEPSS